MKENVEEDLSQLSNTIDKKLNFSRNGVNLNKLKELLTSAKQEFDKIEDYNPSINNSKKDITLPLTYVNFFKGELREVKTMVTYKNSSFGDIYSLNKPCFSDIELRVQTEQTPSPIEINVKPDYLEIILPNDVIRRRYHN